MAWSMKRSSTSSVGPFRFFGQDEHGLALLLFLRLFVFDLHFGTGVVGAGEQADHVGILLDGTGFTKVGKHRALAFSGLHGTVELSEHDDRDVEFFREAFDAGGDFSDLDLAVVLGPPALGGDELQIVDHDHLDAVLLFEAA
jgi:hypothetical protein